MINEVTVWKEHSSIKDRGHLLKFMLIDDINSQGLLPGTILVSFDIVNMFPNIDNKKGLNCLKTLFDSRTTQKPATDCLVEAFHICLYCNNSMSNEKTLLQKMVTIASSYGHEVRDDYISSFISWLLRKNI